MMTGTPINLFDKTGEDMTEDELYLLERRGEFLIFGVPDRENRLDYFQIVDPESISQFQVFDRGKPDVLLGWALDLDWIGEVKELKDFFDYFVTNKIFVEIVSEHDITQSGICISHRGDQVLMLHFDDVRLDFDGLALVTLTGSKWLKFGHPFFDKLFPSSTKNPAFNKHLTDMGEISNLFDRENWIGLLAEINCFSWSGEGFLAGRVLYFDDQVTSIKCFDSAGRFDGYVFFRTTNIERLRTNTLHLKYIEDRLQDQNSIPEIEAGKLMDIESVIRFAYEKDYFIALEDPEDFVAYGKVVSVGNGVVSLQLFDDSEYILGGPIIMKISCIPRAELHTKLLVNLKKLFP